MSLLNINWRTQITRILPVNKRTTSIIDFLFSCLYPLQTKTDELSAWEADLISRRRYNGQKIVLEQALNTIFSILAPPYIYIEWNRSFFKHLWIFSQVDDSPVFLYNRSEQKPLNVYNAAETTGNDYGFTVFVPSGIYTAELEVRIRAEVERYKVAAIPYLVDTF